MYSNLKEFYDSVDNPIGTDQAYKDLVESYSNITNYKFSRALPIVDRSTMRQIQFFANTYDDYCVYLFNLWKNNILDLADNIFDYLKDGNSMRKEINLLKDYLRCSPPPKNSNDVFEIMNPDNVTINDIIKKYGFEKINFNQWNYICSDNFFNGNDPAYHTEHFFAINTKFYDTLYFCKLFQEKCIEKRLPFSYSFYLGDDVSDKVIIQSDTQHLLDYLDIITEIEKDDENLISRCESPSSFTGKVNDYIGYGSQDGFFDNNFYITRTNHIKRCIEFTIFEYLKRNYKKKISGGKNSIFLIDYLSGIITLNYIEFLKNNNCEDFPNLKVEKIESKKLYNHISKYVKTNLLKQLDKAHSFDELNDFNVYYRNDSGRSCFKFTKSFIYSVIRENSIELFDANPNLYSFLKRAVTRSAKTLGIDDKYCFDTSTVKNMFNFEDDSVKKIELKSN